MTYAYRVFVELVNADTDVMHFSNERLYEGAIFRVSKPGKHIHGTPVVVRRVDSHPSPTGDTPGIAHAHVEGVR